MKDTNDPAVEVDDLRLALNDVRDEVRAAGGDSESAPKAELAGFRCEGCGGCFRCYRCEGCGGCYHCEGCHRCFRQP
jgi:hypothetical protein